MIFASIGSLLQFNSKQNTNEKKNITETSGFDFVESEEIYYSHSFRKLVQSHQNTRNKLVNKGMHTVLSISYRRHSVLYGNTKIANRPQHITDTTCEETVIRHTLITCISYICVHYLTAYNIRTCVAHVYANSQIKNPSLN